MLTIMEPHEGPLYPTLSKRKNGREVREAVRMLQRQELERVAKKGYRIGYRAPCASGTRRKGRH
jgi:hypothetical protein